MAHLGVPHDDETTSGVQPIFLAQKLRFTTKQFDPGAQRFIDAPQSNVFVPRTSGQARIDVPFDLAPTGDIGGPGQVTQPPPEPLIPTPESPFPSFNFGGSGSGLGGLALGIGGPLAIKYGPGLFERFKNRFGGGATGGNIQSAGGTSAVTGGPLPPVGGGFTVEGLQALGESLLTDTEAAKLFLEELELAGFAQPGEFGFGEAVAGLPGASEFGSLAPGTQQGGFGTENFGGLEGGGIGAGGLVDLAGLGIQAALPFLPIPPEAKGAIGATTFAGVPIVKGAFGLSGGLASGTSGALSGILSGAGVIGAALAPLGLAGAGIMKHIMGHGINEGKLERGALAGKFNQVFSELGLPQTVNKGQWQDIIGGEEALNASGLDPFLGAITAATLIQSTEGGGGAGGGPMLINGLLKAGASPEQTAMVVGAALGPNFHAAVQTLGSKGLEKQAWNNLITNSRQTMVLDKSPTRRDIRIEDAGRDQILEANSQFLDDILGSLAGVYGATDAEVGLAKDKLMLAREASIDGAGPGGDIASFSDLERNRVELDNLEWALRTGNISQEEGERRLATTQKMIAILEQEGTLANGAG